MILESFFYILFASGFTKFEESFFESDDGMSSPSQSPYLRRGSSHEANRSQDRTIDRTIEALRQELVDARAQASALRLQNQQQNEWYRKALADKDAAHASALTTESERIREEHKQRIATKDGIITAQASSIASLMSIVESTEGRLQEAMVGEAAMADDREEDDREEALRDAESSAESTTGSDAESDAESGEESASTSSSGEEEVVPPQSLEEVRRRSFSLAQATAEEHRRAIEDLQRKHAQEKEELQARAQSALEAALKEALEKERRNHLAHLKKIREDNARESKDLRGQARLDKATIDRLRKETEVIQGKLDQTQRELDQTQQKLHQKNLECQKERRKSLETTEKVVGHNMSLHGEVRALRRHRDRGYALSARQLAAQEAELSSIIEKIEALNRQTRDDFEYLCKEAKQRGLTEEFLGKHKHRMEAKFEILDNILSILKDGYKGHLGSSIAVMARAFDQALAEPSFGEHSPYDHHPQAMSPKSNHGE